MPARWSPPPPPAAISSARLRRNICSLGDTCTTIRCSQPAGRRPSTPRTRRTPSLRLTRSSKAAPGFIQLLNWSVPPRMSCELNVRITSAPPPLRQTRATRPVPPLLRDFFSLPTPFCLSPCLEPPEREPNRTRGHLLRRDPSTHRREIVLVDHRIVRRGSERTLHRIVDLVERGEPGAIDARAVHGGWAGRIRREK